MEFDYKNKYLLLHVIQLYLDSYDRKLFDDDNFIRCDFLHEIEKGNFIDYSFNQYKKEFKEYIYFLKNGKVKYD